MSSPLLFEENLDAIERAIARVCRDAGLNGENGEDFASSVRLALLADDCAILRKFEGRSSMPTYLTIVIRRLLVDAWRAAGRWYASAEAERRGPAAVLLERLTLRERRPFREAVEIVRREHPAVSPRQLEEIASALPERAPRPQLVPVAPEDEERLAGTSSAANLVEALDVAQRSSRANAAIRSAPPRIPSIAPDALRTASTSSTTPRDLAKAAGLFAQTHSPMALVSRYYLAGVRQAKSDPGARAELAAIVSEADSHPAYRALRAHSRWELGRGDGFDYDYPGSIAMYGQSAGLFHDIGDRPNEAFVETMMSVCLATLGRHDESWASLIRALGALSRDGNRPRITIALNDVMRTERLAGRNDAALALARLPQPAAGGVGAAHRGEPLGKRHRRSRVAVRRSDPAGRRHSLAGAARHHHS